MFMEKPLLSGRHRRIGLYPAACAKVSLVPVSP